MAATALRLATGMRRMMDLRKGRSAAVKVLLLEDELRLAETLRRGLGAEGFTVDVVHDGEDGLWSATNYSYDVLVLDIMLPKLNGYEVCKQLRSADIWTPVLMLTAKSGEFDQVDAFDLGADDYLTKPFSFNILVARLRSLVRRGAPQRPVTLQVGDLSLNPASRMVSRGGEEVSLTPREFALLHYLMRHQGDVMSKTEILRSVWDTNYEGDENVVEVCISCLRRKLDLPFGRRSITTVRGAGYRLVADGRTPR